MESLLNPNIAYVLIVATVLIGLVAIIIPGTGLPEVALAFCVMLAAYEVYKLGINVWALAILAVSVVPFLVTVRTKKWWIPLLALSILLMIAGSVFLFTDARGWPAVNPVLAVIVSLASGLLVWFGAERAATAMQREPVHNLDALIGRSGEARTAIHAEGSVQAGSELWSARSEKPIEAGSAVRIVGREGFILIVEKETKS